MTTRTLKFEQTIQVSPDIVLRAFINASVLRRWLCDVTATVDPRPGGRLYMCWGSGYYMCGEYTAIEPGHSVSFTWYGRGTPGIAKVRVAVEPLKDGTRLTLEHTFPEASPVWQTAYEQAEAGWRTGLADLVSVLETGLDPRFVNRPMLGLTFSDYNAEIARELGVPTSEGVRLDMTIEGMGAYMVGLRSNDVIVELGGLAMRSFSDFSLALAGKRAGDTIEVVYYRGSERRIAEMTLSRRPLPEVPWSQQALAAAARRNYDEVEDAMAQFFANVSEEEADYRPNPDAWTIKEILAHLLQGEYGKQNHIDEVVSGFENWSDGWGGNLDAHVRATVTAYPTLADLLKEIQRNFTKTVAFYLNLPDDFLQKNKAGYWALAYDELEAPYHFHTHQEQMAQNIEAARRART